MQHDNPEFAEKAEEIIETLFADLDDPDNFLFLEERLDDDPEMARAIQAEFDKNPTAPSPDVFPFGFSMQPPSSGDTT